MSLVTRILHRPRRRTAGALAAGVALALCPAAAALAAGPSPEHGSFSNSLSGNDSDTCAAEGVTFHFVLTEHVDYTVFFNSDGSQRYIIAHHSQQVTITANGTTLRENDHFTNRIYPDGSAVVVGSYTHIQGDNGLVLRDAGRFVVDADGQVSFVAGPHPSFSGATFCAALQP